MASVPLHERSSSMPHDSADSPPSRPQSYSGSPAGTSGTVSRLKNRLHLRNAGFRGAEIPARKVTPRSGVSSSFSDSAAMQTSTSNLSDAENISPSGKHASDTTAHTSGRRNSSGILQDMGNSATVRQTKPVRSRVMSGRFFSPDPANTAQDGEDGSAHKRTRSVRARAKTNKTRRSVSGETRQYVEHLETELSSAQAQISALGSPSATRELSATMRHLKAETKQLHEEIADWERKYEERVQEEVDRHFQLEASLRSRLRNMELEAEETRFRLQELETQLNNTTETLNATETANVNLEKRLEIMSEMLAASPTKLDFHIDERPRHGRQRSMLPRFPTAGALKLPERNSFIMASSPASSRMSMQFTADQVNNFSPEAFSSDDDHTVSEVNMASSTYNGMQQPQLQRTNTKRRMRRFGAGSMGPKPLILPSTSHHDSVWGSGPPSVLSSAPPLERHEMSSVLPFAPEYHMPDRESTSRRQSSVDSYTRSLPPSLPGSPILLHQPMYEEPVSAIPDSSADDPSDDDEALLEEYIENSPLLEISLNTTPTFGNSGNSGTIRGPGPGRNLMDELAAAQTSEAALTNTEAYSSPAADDEDSSSPPRTSSRRFHSVTEVFTQHPHGPVRLNSNTSITPRHRRLHRRISSRAGQRSLRPRSITSLPPSTTPSTSSSLSTLDNLGSMLSTLFRSPVAMAKYLVETAQSRTPVPSSLFNVQWWLVGVLLGPMAKKRLLRQQKREGLLPCCVEEAERRALLSSPDGAEAGGTFLPTPGSSSASPSSAAANRLHKRRSSRDATTTGRCPHHPNGHPHSTSTTTSTTTTKMDTTTKRSKHSPWLWLKFSLTLAIAVGVAFKDGPGSLLRMKVGGAGGKGVRCTCCRRTGTIPKDTESREEGAGDQEASGLSRNAKKGVGTVEHGVVESRTIAEEGGGGGGMGSPDGGGGEDVVIGGLGEAVGKVVEGVGGAAEAPG